MLASQAVEGEDEAVHEERGVNVERAATTATSLDAEQDSGYINRTQSAAIPNVPFPQGISSGGSPRVIDLENVKDAQALEIKKLKKRVKKLERKNKSRTPQLKRRVYKPRVESSDDSLVTTAGETVTTANVNPEDSIDVDVIPTRLVDDSTTDDVTLAETLMAIISS
ncbi:hypothetical protein Tco_0082440, partial [Tanacetum coccineum]